MVALPVASAKPFTSMKVPSELDCGLRQLFELFEVRWRNLGATNCEFCGRFHLHVVIAQLRKAISKLLDLLSVRGDLPSGGMQAGLCHLCRFEIIAIECDRFCYNPALVIDTRSTSTLSPGMSTVLAMYSFLKPKKRLLSFVRVIGEDHSDFPIRAAHGQDFSSTENDYSPGLGFVAISAKGGYPC